MFTIALLGPAEPDDRRHPCRPDARSTGCGRSRPGRAHVTSSNFIAVFTEQPFARWLLNSAIVAAATTVLGVFLACTAAYAFSRFRFPGRRAGLMSFLVSQMFPGTLMMIPLYIIIVQFLGLGSNFIGLILVYSITGIPFCVWMLKGYFDTIPKELEESALMDGASAATIFYRIVLPLAKPAVAVTALFSFMTAWNEFIQAATFMDKANMYTAPVGLRFFVGGFSQQWGYFAAGAIVTAIPVVAALPVPAEVPRLRPHGRGGQGLDGQGKGGARTANGCKRWEEDTRLKTR